MTTSRTDFIETWLTEMPEGSGNVQTYQQLKFDISDLKQYEIPVTDLGNNLKKVELSQTAYYWYEQHEIIELGSELEKRPQGLVVRLTGKNPDIKGSHPFASDLYDTILKDNRHLSLRLLSDIQLSDEGFAIWKKLFALGHKISVYDVNEPGKTFDTFSSSDDMDQYFKHGDRDYKRYQYVLSESGSMLAETRGFFHTRRYRESSGLSTED